MKRQALLVPVAILPGILVGMNGYELFYWNKPHMIFAVLRRCIRSADLYNETPPHPKHKQCRGDAEPIFAVGVDIAGEGAEGQVLQCSNPRC